MAYPEIRKLAKKLKANIYFGDEAGVRSDYHSDTTRARVERLLFLKARVPGLGSKKTEATTNDGTLLLQSCLKPARKSTYKT